jgi:hypothetical protein
MSEPLDWNAKTIAEFRANEGRVGGNFEGAPIVLVHHRGRKSGREWGSGKPAAAAPAPRQSTVLTTVSGTQRPSASSPARVPPSPRH